MKGKPNSHLGLSPCLSLTIRFRQGCKVRDRSQVKGVDRVIAREN